MELGQYRALADAALNEWAPGSTTKFKPLKQGLSGAMVLRVEIRGEHSGDLENGQYILKLSHHPKWQDQEDETKTHKRAFEWDTDFANSHIPNLVKTFEL